MITICAFSDGHGKLPIIEDPFDLMLIAGDNVDLLYQRNSDLTKQWYLNDFANWINTLPFKDNDSKVIFICGNHEVAFQRFTFSEKSELINKLQEKTHNRVIYLENEDYHFLKGNDEYLYVFGTPYCKIFGRWAYMETQEKLKELYSQIPDNCDILLTHDAPYGTSDLCYGWFYQGRNPEHIGSQALQDAIVEKKPRINIHGHLHSANHNMERLSSTRVYCVSIVDEDYDEVYQPLYLTI